MVCKYDHVSQLLHDTSASNQRKNLLDYEHRPDLAPHIKIFESLRAWLAFSDPPLHTQLRRVYRGFFSMKMIQSQKEPVIGTVTKVLDEVLRKGTGHVDFLNEIAYPIALQTIARIIGFPTEDFPRIRRWARAIAFLIGARGEKKDKAAAVQKDFDEVIEYSKRLIRHAEATPPSDTFVSKMVHGNDEVKFHEHGDLLAYHLVDLIYAGHANVVNLMTMGVGTLLLSENRDAYNRLKADPSLAPSAVEEMLRLTSPTQMLGRIATRDCVLGGVNIVKGDALGIDLYAANRYPAKFSCPHLMDLNREATHVAFGGGMHVCIGQDLARLETEILLTQLLQRMPQLRLVSENYQLKFNQNLTFRSSPELPLLY